MKKKTCLKTAVFLSVLISLQFLQLTAAEASAESGKNYPRQKDFFLPPVIYAVPGIETNIYFRNVFLTVNPANFIYDADCSVGRNDLKRWRFIPEMKDVGKSYPLTLKIRDDSGLVAVGSTTVCVAPADAGTGRSLSVLMIGDSLTNATVYPERLLQLMKKEQNPVFRMIGSHRGSGRPPEPGGVAHEGYGGWTWQTFLIRYLENIPADASQAKKHYAHSPFLFKDGNRKIFSLKRYLQKYNQDKAPDFITFQLGVNDVFAATEENLNQYIKKILANADRFLNAVRKDAPDAVIGVGYVTGGAGQDAFGNNYRCGQTAWDYNRNHFRLNQAMYQHFKERVSSRFVMVPVQLNLDRENNFPERDEYASSGSRKKILRQRNGVHPAPVGYNQIGDSYYAWMKYMLSQQK